MSSAHQLTASLAAAQQYRAALAASGSLGSAAATMQQQAHQAQQAQAAIIAQYQSLVAVGVPPDVILKQYPHLAAGLHQAAVAASSQQHLIPSDLILAREREIAAAERERQLR